MNRQLFSFLAATLVLNIAPSLANAQTLNCPQPLNFGSFSTTCAGAGTATITPATGNQNTTGCLSADGAPFNPANCSVSQSFPFQNIQVSTPASISITRVSGTETLTVDTFNLETDGGGNVYNTSASFDNIPIGATVQKSGVIVSGEYTGMVTVTAIFN